MSIEILEYVRQELIAYGLVRDTPEFYCSWLACGDGYLGALQHHRLQPSVEALARCSHKLGSYADGLRTSDDARNRAWAERLDRLSLLCEQASAQVASAKVGTARQDGAMNLPEPESVGQNPANLVDAEEQLVEAPVNAGQLLAEGFIQRGGAPPHLLERLRDV